MLAQRLIVEGTSEITWFESVLDPIHLTGAIVTADAPHTTRDPHQRGASYMFTITANQHHLHDHLTTPP